VLSQSSRYALQALVFMARAGGPEAFLARHLADELGLPQNYLSKVLHTLARRGILVSTRGVRGGFRLARPPEEIRLMEIVDPFEDVSRFSRCLLGRPECRDDAACSIHRRWRQVAEAYEQFLTTTTLADASRLADASGPEAPTTRP
jgi:Rrf2 family protein